jgi:DNA-binding PadR family transcriptional regulator
MDAVDTKALQREVLLSFWKVHILHHAAEGPVVGQWMLQELRHHGYDVSPGTLYPILHRMERLGWLRCEVNPTAGSRARRSYYSTRKGQQILRTVKRQLRELKGELEGARSASKKSASNCKSGRKGGSQ